MNAAAEGYRRFAETRGRTLAATADLSQEELDRRPAPGKWSVGEVLGHLLLAEEYYRGEMATLIGLARAGRPPVLRRSFAEIDISVGFFPKALLPLFEIPITLAGMLIPRAVRNLLVRSRFLPAQNPTFATPCHGRPGAELRAGLAASIQETGALLAANADLDYGRMILQHPLMGTNDVPAMLRFLASHEQRHQEQIREALATTGRRPNTGPRRHARLRSCELSMDAKDPEPEPAQAARPELP